MAALDLGVPPAQQDRGGPAGEIHGRIGLGRPGQLPQEAPDALGVG
jgi:hypothetical protein